MQPLSSKILLIFLQSSKVVFIGVLYSQQIQMKESERFSFKDMKKKHLSKDNKKQKEQEQGERLVLYEDLVINPAVAKQFDKMEKDYVTYYNNNRYFYLHTEPENINTLEKIKNDEFNQIRKQYEKTLLVDKKTSEKNKDLPELSPRKRISKVEKQFRFKRLSYLFKKNIKFIISKLKMMKLTVQDIFEKKLFSGQAYQFGKQIFEAVKFGDDTKVWRYYIQNKFVVYSVDSSAKTPLLWACTRGYSAIAEMLIGMGALINKKDIIGHSALYYAIYYKQIDCIKVLILNDAIVSKEDTQLALQDKKIKNIIELGQSIMPIIKKMPYEKRTTIFEQRLKQLK